MAKAKKKKKVTKKSTKKKAVAKKSTKKKAVKKKVTKKAAKKKSEKKKIVKKSTKKKVAKKKVVKKSTKKKVAKKKVVKKSSKKKVVKKKVVKDKVEQNLIPPVEAKVEVNKVTPKKEAKGKIKKSVKIKQSIPEETQVEIDELTSNIQERIVDLKEFFSWKDIEEAIFSLDLFVPDTDECMSQSCDNIRTTGLYCRYHYIANWKEINSKKEILKEGKLQNFIEELISKYPDSYIKALIDDLSEERDFNKVLSELNIVDSEVELDEFENVDDADNDDDDVTTETRDFSHGVRISDEQ